LGEKDRGRRKARGQTVFGPSRKHPPQKVGGKGNTEWLNHGSSQEELI